MHARMFTFEGSPEEIEAAVALTREQILPLERGMPGFGGLILLSDKEEQRLISVSLWESEELMRRSEEAAMNPHAKATPIKVHARCVGAPRSFPPP